MLRGKSAESFTRRSIILGTAGHIDHGKTALVRALTGVDTDRLPEEKRRGITIDLGFASFEAQTTDGSTLQLSFIDVPGHARFVRNMLAGAGGIDAVILTIAANDGVKPQTREHLAICSLLGLERGIVVLTKADTVSEGRLMEARKSASNFLEGTFLASAPVIAVSSHSGFNIAELQHAIVRMASTISERRSGLLLRLPIDRAFVIKGFGTVVTGTLIGGRVCLGDELEIAPGGRIVRVRGIQVHSRAEQEAFAGSRVALNLAHVDTAEIERGNTCISPASATAVITIDVQLSVLAGQHALKHRSRVHFHAFATECLATVALYDAPSMEPGDAGLARLRLSEPVVLLPEDRFVLRTGTPVTTIGGGRVLDAYPPPQAKKAKTADWLREIAGSSFERRVWLSIARRGVRGLLGSELSKELGVTEATFADLVQRWIREGRIHCTGETRWLTQEAFTEARQAVLCRLEDRSQDRDHDRNQANSADVRRSELKEQTGLAAEIFNDVLRSIERDGRLQIVGEFVMQPASATLPDSDQGHLASVAREYEQAGVTPPYPDDLGMRLGIAPAEMRRLITLLLREKTLVRLNSESLCVHQSALAALTEKMRSLRGQTLDVAAFKDLTGVSRKFAIPLLEYLDRERVTVRQGDRRLIL